MDLCDVVEAWLKENKFDGLFLDQECACLVGDLMPCGEPFTNCEPGYKTETGDGGFDFSVGAMKPDGA